jgi:hypothetical protein
VQQVVRFALTRTDTQAIPHGVTIAVVAVTVTVAAVPMMMMSGIRIGGFFDVCYSLLLRLKVKGMQFTIHEQKISMER